MSTMGKIHASRSVRLREAVLLAIIAATVGSPGCGREERGPELLGGREVKSWVADLHSPKPQVRRQAVIKLGNVGDADPSVAAGLVEALNDSDPLVRRDAILAVVRLKDPSATVKERLESMSRSDKDARARDLARKAVIRLGGVE
jgi:HEAT repeat protein